ncbi:TPA: hypothetical protein ACFP4Y_000671 [Neisseria bacilliformis]|nr:hypothetical protein [Neisseria bacilliformis]
MALICFQTACALWRPSEKQKTPPGKGGLRHPFGSHMFSDGLYASEAV